MKTTLSQEICAVIIAIGVGYLWYEHHQATVIALITILLIRFHQLNQK